MFVHLHLHTHYSLLDGAIEIGRLMAAVKKLKMPAVAITDHGNMFGAVEFYSAAIRAGIRPIIGMEAYLAPRHRGDKQAKCIGGDFSYHLLLLAQNLAGYRNLMKLASLGYREGFYYKPRIDKEVLAEFSEGLICTSTCLGAELPQILLHRDQKQAEETAKDYLTIFGPDRFYIEVQDHDIPEQRQINPVLFDMAQRLGVGVVATNDVHYLTADDTEAHDVLCCISTGSLLSEENRFKFPSDQFYLKSAEEMSQLFPDHPEVLANTLAVADLCALELDFTKRYAPVYQPPQGKTDTAFLRDLVYEGADERYEALTDEIRRRIDYELDVISSKGFSSYFLICWDLVHYARQHGIPCAARGSGCSSVVAYCLGISAPDPLRYGLYFERFLDPDRDEMPDIDIDICQEGRPQIIDYVRNRYGHVAQIITFGTLKARAAVKDVARVMGIDFQRASRLTELIPADLNMTIEKALELEPELRRLCGSDPQIAKVIDVSKRIEGLARHAGVHAAGVVIADQPLDNFLPLYKPPDNGHATEEQVVTQYDGNTVERVGLLKMDFLGLRTLSILERARRMVESNHGVKIDLEHLDLADPNVFTLFSRGETKGVFQFESEGMRDVLRRMRPNRIEDLIAANALYRPGPMVNIDAYVSRKHGERWTTPHPLMTEILEETYGIMVYQEQVSRVVNRLGGIELKQAFRLAKAISKKKSDDIEAMRQPFVEGCRKNGLSLGAAKQIFDDILRFGGYAFNKAHSTGYALIAFKTAYMKATYPLEFMAALLSSEMGSTDKVVEYVEECKRMEIPVKPPDINICGYGFTPVYNQSAVEISRQSAVGSRQESEAPQAEQSAVVASGTLPEDQSAVGSRQSAVEESSVRSSTQHSIRFGLGAIKGVGEKAVQAIVSAREKGGPFGSLFDLCECVNLSAVNRSALEAMIKSGALDGLGAQRKVLTLALDSALEAGQALQRDRNSGQLSLLGSLGDQESPPASSYPRISDQEQWNEAERLSHEKEVLGFYVTGHPLAHLRRRIEQFATETTKGLARCADGQEVILGGMVVRLRTRVTKTGRNAGSKMGLMTFEDTAGSIEAILFPAELDRFRPFLAVDSIVFLKGQVDRRREEPSVRVAEVIPFDQAPEKLTTEVLINLSIARHAPEILEDLYVLLTKHRGDKPVVLRITTGDHVVALRCGPALRILPSEDVCKQLENLLGPDCVRLRGHTGMHRVA